MKRKRNLKLALGGGHLLSEQYWVTAGISRLKTLLEMTLVG